MIMLFGVIHVKGNQLIRHDGPVNRNRSFLYDCTVGIPLLPAHEPYTFLLPPGKEGIIHITPIHDDNGSFGEGEVLGNLHLMGKSVSDLSEDREIAVMVEQEMELDGTLGLAIDSPVEERDAQFNQSRIETEELIFEAELYLCRSTHPYFLKQLMEDCLIESEGSFLIGIGEGGTSRGSFYAEMLELAHTTCKVSADLP
jgi:hypothetical protein